MAITTPPPPDIRQWPRPGAAPRIPRSAFVLGVLGGIALLAVLAGGYVWFIQRVEVPAGKVLVLVRKVGEELPQAAEGQVVLHPALLRELGELPDSTRYKGILYEVRPEGRYFYDPFFWQTELRDMTLIGPNEVAIQVRRYGRPLTGDKVVATDDGERGPLREVLLPGTRHNLNPYAYHVVRVERIRVPEGSVGVVTLYAGRPPANPNQYVVEDGERGVQPGVLPPGLYNINPFEKRVDIIDVRSHTIDFRDNDSIRFPSKDSFEILLEGTVEYAIRQDRAPYVMAAIGDHDDVRQKLVLPFMRSFSRIEGSKLEGREFISGDTRKAFQDRVFAGVRQQCDAQGIEIRAALIRRIEPPVAIANPISERQLADQQIDKYKSQIERALVDAEVVQQEEMRNQNQEVGQANREVVSIVTRAEQSKAVALTEANKRLEVAKLELDAASETAAAILSRGQAEAEVIRLGYEAEARPLRQAIDAFGGGEIYAQYFFFQKLSPALKSVLDSTDGPFAEIFRSLSKAARGPDSGAAPQAPQDGRTN